MKKSFDIHLASDVISPNLESRLIGLGFRKDAFIGGTTGVVHPCHYSYRPLSQLLFVQTWEKAICILSAASSDDFHGYAEAEITPLHFNIPLKFKPYDSSVAFPLGRLEHEACPLDKHKDLDIHLTANLSSINPDLKRLLEEDISFNYVDIRKPSGTMVRVYTFQPLGVKGITKLYKLLVTYLQKAGGLEGKIKLEATYAFARFPSSAPVPPVITKLASVLSF
jgi:hypothetical protein